MYTCACTDKYIDDPSLFHMPASEGVSVTDQYSESSEDGQRKEVHTKEDEAN